MKTTYNFYAPNRNILHPNPSILETGNISVLTLEADNVKSPFALNQKSVIFVIDISASMLHTLEAVKDSLLAFQKVIGDSFPDLDIKIVTFSNDANVIWRSKGIPSSEIGTSFENVVKSIHVECSTNMGDGILKAFEECEPSKVTWIVILTDGESNKGSYQTQSAFLNLKDDRPHRSKLVTIGYGREFNVDLLVSLGDDFVYMEDTETIFRFMGGLSNEIMSSSFFNVYVDTDLSPVIGTNKMGTLFNERSVTVAHKNFQQNITIKYTHITEEKNFEGSLNIKNDSISSEIPPSIKKCYYQSECANHILYLYTYKNFKVLRSVVDQIRDTVLVWEDNESRETLLRFCDKVLSRSDISTSTYAGDIHYATSARNQSSHVIDQFSTPMSKTYGSMVCAQTYSDAYPSSPIKTLKKSYDIEEPQTPMKKYPISQVRLL